MKKLSRNEMKKVMGGDAQLDVCAVACHDYPNGGVAWQCTSNSTSPLYFCMPPGAHPNTTPADMQCGIIGYCGAN